MDDLVERLRAAREQWWLDILIEAADEIERLRAALRIIAGQEQCIDNLMSNVDVAREALAEKGGR